MNFYRNVDRDVVQFDFLANKPAKGDYDDEIRDLGGRIFVSPGFMSYNKYVSYMTELFREHPEYKIIHTHNGALMIYALRSAKKCGIPHRIAHAHATSIPAGRSRQLKVLLRPLIKYAATDYWGCSNAAGEFYFSKRRWDERHELIHNAINVSDFSFNESARAELRKKYSLGDKFVIGHVGRLVPEKNQKKMIEIFAEVHKMNPNTHFVMVGTGELEDKLKAQSAELGLSNDITFTGVQTNVSEWYSTFDVFIMTSIYEGLPVVAVEAQGTDLPCVLCSTITPEVKVTQNVKFLGLHDEAATWARAILDIERTPRVSRAKELTLAGYDIKTEAKRMQDLYTKLYASFGEK